MDVDRVRADRTRKLSLVALVLWAPMALLMVVMEVFDLVKAPKDEWQKWDLYLQAGHHLGSMCSLYWVILMVLQCLLAMAVEFFATGCFLVDEMWTTSPWPFIYAVANWRKIRVHTE